MSGAVEGVEDARAAFYAESTVAMQRQEGDQVVTVEGFLRALSRLTTPPARSYADGVEDAAKVAEKLVGDRDGVPERIRIAAAIRLLSQGERA
jgi:hypothetical protein